MNADSSMLNLLDQNTHSDCSSGSRCSCEACASSPRFEEDIEEETSNNSETDFQIDHVTQSLFEVQDSHATTTIQVQSKDIDNDQVKCQVQNTQLHTQPSQKKHITMGIQLFKKLTSSPNPATNAKNRSWTVSAFVQKLEKQGSSHN